MPKIGNIEIDLIEKVDRGTGAKSSDHALEEGEPVTDHVESETKTISISGTIIDPTGAKRNLLEKYEAEGTLHTFNFTSRLENVIIESFNTTNDSSIKDGYSFTMSLKQIRIATKGKTVKVSGDVKLKTADIKNAGRIQVQK